MNKRARRAVKFNTPSAKIGRWVTERSLHGS